MPEITDPPELPPLPPNACTLSVRPAQDGVHTFLRLTFDCTHLTDDQKKLLTFMVSNALTELEIGVKKMDKIAVASRLAKLERINAMKGNGQ